MLAFIILNAIILLVFMISNTIILLILIVSILSISYIKAIQYVNTPTNSDTYDNSCHLNMNLFWYVDSYGCGWIVHNITQNV